MKIVAHGRDADDNSSCRPVFPAWARTGCARRTRRSSGSAKKRWGRVLDRSRSSRTDATPTTIALAGRFSQLGHARGARGGLDALAALRRSAGDGCWIVLLGLRVRQCFRRRADGGHLLGSDQVRVDEIFKLLAGLEERQPLGLDRPRCARAGIATLVGAVAAGLKASQAANLDAFIAPKCFFEAIEDLVHQHLGSSPWHPLQLRHVFDQIRLCHRLSTVFSRGWGRRAVKVDCLSRALKSSSAEIATT